MRNSKAGSARHLSVLIQKENGKEKPFDVDGIYEALQDKMARMLAADPKHMDALQMVKEIEHQVIGKVSRIKQLNQEQVQSEEQK
jgi:hypothetical protein